MGKCSFVLIFIIFSSSVVGEDLIWRQNSNWRNPANWKSNAVPCGGNEVSFEKSDDPFAVFIDDQVTVRKITLPKNGKLVFGKKGRLAFSSSTASCDDGKDGGSKSEVVFAPRASFWDCPENWMKSDGSVPASAPCGSDVAVFPENNTFSFVSQSSSLLMLRVAGIRMRGTAVQTVQGLEAEFRGLNLTLNPLCSSKPEQCACPKPGPLCQPPSPSPSPSPVVGKTVSGGVIAAVVIVLIVIILLATVILIAVVLYLKLRGSSAVPYNKDELSQSTVTFEKEEEGVNFDNPIFDSTSDFSAGVLPGTEDVDEISIAVEGETGNYDDDEKLI